MGDSSNITNSSRIQLLTSYEPAYQKFKYSDGFEVFATAAYAFIGFVAIVGNGLCFATFYYKQKSCRHSSVTIYLLNLAVCDFLMAVLCIPFTAYNILREWTLPIILCKLVQLAQMCFVIASIITNIVIAYRRLRTFKNPLRNHVKFTITLIWLMSFAASSFYLWIGDVKDGSCQENIPDDSWLIFWTVSITIVSFFLPMAIILTLYIKTGLILLRKASSSGTQLTRIDSGRKDKSRVSKTLFCVAACFCLSWTPIHLLLIIIAIDPHIVIENPIVIHYAYVFCHLLAMSHAVHNPLIFICSSANFRGKILQMLFKEKSRRENISLLERWKQAERLASEKHTRQLTLKDQHC